VCGVVFWGAMRGGGGWGGVDLREESRGVLVRRGVCMEREEKTEG